jgi:hypothetical protein
MLKLSCSFDSVPVRFMLLLAENMNSIPNQAKYIVGAGAAGAASRYGSGSDQKILLLANPAPQHC